MLTNVVPEKKQTKLTMIITDMLMTGVDGIFILAIPYHITKIMIQKIVTDGLELLFIIIVTMELMSQALQALKGITLLGYRAFAGMQN